MRMPPARLENASIKERSVYMSQDFQNPFSMWAESNKQMIDAWNAWASNAANTVHPKAKPEDDSEGKKPFDTDQLYKNWSDSMKSMSSFIPNKAAKEGFDRFFNSYQMFNGLQSYWDKFFKSIPATMTDWDSLAKSVMEQYQNLSGGFISSFIPDQLKSFFTMPLGNFTALQQSFMYFLKPWIEDSAVLQGYLLKTMMGDKEAYAEFLKEWTNLYSDSFAQMLNMPAVGSNRVAVEKMMKLLDDYVNFTVLFNEFTVRISNMMSGAMERLIKHLAELHAKGEQPQTFMDFCKLWSNFNELAFEELYATDEFSKIMNETVSAGSKLQIMSDDFMQDMLSFLPFPNISELDDVAMEVYKLRKKVKSLEKEMKKMKEQS
jgi:class III poly(R)-hydroxyalkanoic acid synthase PhaE subunit